MIPTTNPTLIAYMDTFKTGMELSVSPCESLIQHYPITGKIKFDSWDKKYDTLFVTIENKPAGLRFLIDVKNVLVP